MIVPAKPEMSYCIQWWKQWELVSQWEAAKQIPNFPTEPMLSHEIRILWGDFFMFETIPYGSSRTFWKEVGLGYNLRKFGGLAVPSQTVAMDP